MSNFMGVGIFWIGLNRADLGCWRLTLSPLGSHIKAVVFLKVKEPYETAKLGLQRVLVKSFHVSYKPILFRETPYAFT